MKKRSKIRGVDISGKRFHKLKAIKVVGYDKQNYEIWHCKCDCGNTCDVNIKNLVHDHTKSCGCLKMEALLKRSTSHGMSHTKFYDIYCAIFQRCNNPQNKRYEDYGGRGIKLLWKSFEEFKDDMYESYLEHQKLNVGRNTTLDRVDNDGDYCKENCKWVTYKKQNRNKRNNHYVTINGKTHIMADWVRILNANYSSVKQKIRRGMGDVEALLTSIKGAKNNGSSV